MKPKILDGWFDVDVEGFREQEKRKPIHRQVQELISNSFDEETVKIVSCRIKYDKRKKVAFIEVEDDGEGFADVTDSYTMYKHSNKVENPEQRGRFNRGEKQFIAICTTAFVKTSGVQITYSYERGKYFRALAPVKTKGTIVFGKVPCTEKQVETAIKMLSKIIVPTGKYLYINGVQVFHKKPARSFTASLATEIWNAKIKEWSDTRRVTEVELYYRDEGERVSWIYEYGIRVASLSTPFHVNVLQKIPLNIGRDKVRPAWLKQLYAVIMDNAHDLITDSDAKKPFIEEALSKVTSKEAAEDLIRKRKNIPEDTPIFLSSTDYHINERAMEHGAVIEDLDGETRRHLKALGVAQYASDRFKVDYSATAKPVKITPEMADFAWLVQAISKDTLGSPASVEFVKSDADAEAWTDGVTLTFNMRLAKIGSEITPRNIEVIIHELAHFKEHPDNRPHLSSEFIHEVERIAAIVAFKGLDHYKKEAGLK